MNNLNPVNTVNQFKAQREVLARMLYYQPTFDRGEVHAQKVVDQTMATKELTHVNLVYNTPDTIEDLQKFIKPNLPWAEDHFQERVSGEPLNPPPSNEWWPFNRNKNAEHKKDEVFSHTYPERFWPRKAGKDWQQPTNPHVGIRFPWGDLDDLIEVLKKNPRSRQAYLPIWFPEDIAAAREGERVPCTLGYHFMMNSSGELDLFYPMRSCDFLRFMLDDIYMAGRLQQLVAQQSGITKVGSLYMSISSLHVFKGDEYTLAQMIQEDDDDNENWLRGVSG